MACRDRIDAGLRQRVAFRSLRLRAKQQLERAELGETGFEDRSKCDDALRVTVHLEAMPFGDESLQDGVEEPTWLSELLGNRRSDAL